MSVRPVRIANISGMFGDRPSAALEMLEGGDVDVLSGDWLAELTMLIMARTRMRRPDGGYGRTFVAQMEQIMGIVLDRDVKVVVNAGGLDPLGCAEAVREVGNRLGLAPTVAAITGDDLSGRLGDLVAAGAPFINLDTGEPLDDKADRILTANAYLGGWGIASALGSGADIVVTGRVTDASLAVGPAAWWHEWARDDWDALAGAVVAGHVIECSMQATGGNFSFFGEVAGLEYPGFPWVEVAADGSGVVGIHEGAGGEVSIPTVTSQLLYEIGSPEYDNADVTARFDSIEIEEIAPNRVRLSGIKGQPPPRTLKVAAAYAGGFRNTMMIGLTGLDAKAKADLFCRQFWRACPWDPEDYEEVRTTLIGRGERDPSSNAAAVSYLEIAVRDPDEEKVGRSWADTMVHIALGSIPGLFGVWPPRKASPYAVYWPTLIDREAVTDVVHLGERSFAVPETDPGEPFTVTLEEPRILSPPSGSLVRVPLGRVVGARSGDKGGSANLGVFTRTDDGYPWLTAFLTVDRLIDLLPDLAEYEIDRYELPRLRAVNFVVHGILDEGVSSSLRFDAQAKGLGEYLRAKWIEVPAALTVLQDRDRTDQSGR
ncbi:MAG TPA: DUF1446 domain-containing protein [Actinobacteria bacterium]|nr:DUF1446 domain-containing protein [Actinomycetota bacterium]